MMNLAPNEWALPKSRIYGSRSVGALGQALAGNARFAPHASGPMDLAVTFPWRFEASAQLLGSMLAGSLADPLRSQHVPVGAL
jgi:hypothetical protein